MTAPTTAAPAKAKPSRVPAEPDDRVAGVVSALLAPAAADAPRGNTPPALRSIDPQLIDIGANVRTTVGDVSELAASIAENGLLQPVKVLGPHADTGRYSLVYGQRRLTAVLKLGLPTISAIVVEPGGLGNDARTRRTVEQLLENAQREDLDAISVARALKGLVDAGMSQAHIATAIAKSPAYVSNTLGLLDTAVEVQQAITEGKLTGSHAKAIASFSKSDQVELVKVSLKRGLSAHGLEEHAAWVRQQAEDVKSANAKFEASRAALLKKLTVNLIKRGLVKAAQIRVYCWRDTDWIVEALRSTANGYSHAKAGGSYREPKPAAEYCNCKAWDVEVNSGEPTIHPGCIVAAHREAARKGEQEKRTAERAAEEAPTKAAELRVAAAVVAELAERPLGALTMRLMFLKTSGQLDAWAKGRPGAGEGRKPDIWGVLLATPDAELTEDLAKRLAESWQAPAQRIVAGFPVEGQVTLTEAIAEAGS